MDSIIVRNISKTYPGQPPLEALKDISFEVKPGELFGLIGPDGAGKTSLFRILTTLLLPDGGSALVEGFDTVAQYKEIRNIVGYMPGKFSLYQDLSIQENLNFFAKVFNTTVEENYGLIEDIYVQIEPFKHRKAGKLSGGMKQKLALCCALIHQPKVLFLDEPTTGVDPVSRKEFWEMLKRLKAKNISILVSTPYMDEAKLCDRIALIQAGEILSIDTPEEIIGNFHQTIYSMQSSNNFHLLQALRQNTSVNTCYMFGEYLHVTLHVPEATQLVENLRRQGHPDIKAEMITPTIEDCFISLMK